MRIDISLIGNPLNVLLNKKSSTTLARLFTKSMKTSSAVSLFSILLTCLALSSYLSAKDWHKAKFSDEKMESFAHELKMAVKAGKISEREAYEKWKAIKDKFGHREDEEDFDDDPDDWEDEEGFHGEEELRELHFDLERRNLEFELERMENEQDRERKEWEHELQRMEHDFARERMEWERERMEWENELEHLHRQRDNERRHHDHPHQDRN